MFGLPTVVVGEDEAREGLRDRQVLAAVAALTVRYRLGDTGVVGVSELVGDEDHWYTHETLCALALKDLVARRIDPEQTDPDPAEFEEYAYIWWPTAKGLYALWSA